MLKDYFNADIVSQMTFKEFEATYKGSQVLVRLRIDIKRMLLKELGGKMNKSKKYKSND